MTRERRLRDGGYTRFGILDGEGGFNAWNVGAGVHLWFGDHAGARLEFAITFVPTAAAPQHWSSATGVGIR